MRRQGGGTELWRRLKQRKVCTVTTRMEHMVSGEQKENDFREIGPRHGKMRDVRNVLKQGAWDMTRRKRGHMVEENDPKVEEESYCIKRYWNVSQRTRD